MRLFTFFLLSVFPLFSSPLLLTESDPDAFVEGCINVIEGKYCEADIDLLVAGPDCLTLQRFYNAEEGWKIFPECFLVVGADSKGRALAFSGERSGGTLPYTGKGSILQVDISNSALGIVNTYSGELNGQTNHQNNRLHYQENTCEITLGDGTKRFYQKAKASPSIFFGEEYLPKISDPNFFLLQREVLPSGNQIFFDYDQTGHLISVELKNRSSTKTLSWIRFSYTFEKQTALVQIETSDAKKLKYHLEKIQGRYQLLHVEGSHCIPISYEYQKEMLVRKILPEGRFVEVEYQDRKVKFLKGPNVATGESEVVYSFFYGDNYTDVYNAIGTKSRYFCDNRSQLTAIERYDEQDKLYRVDRKYWGNSPSQTGLLLAKTIEDGLGKVHSYRSFQYDANKNVTEEKIYGNLTGQKEADLLVSPEGEILSSEEECSTRKFEYSNDGLNLLVQVGDCKGNKTVYQYLPGTNLLIRKFIYDRKTIKKRTFQYYNEDAVLVKSIEDDGSQESETDIFGWGVTERHIKIIQPKGHLPETIEERALDLKKREEILVKKISCTYDEQSNLLSCRTFDANGEYAFTEEKAYNCHGQIISEIDRSGRETLYTYDELGNQTSKHILCENRLIETNYNFKNLPTHIKETTPDDTSSIYFSYDTLGRKIGSTDRFGHTTHYQYDSFHRLTKVTHPEVLNEEEITRPIFQYTYDLFGNAISVTDPNGYTTTKQYTLRGDPSKIDYPDGSCERFKYDTEGTLHRSLTRDGLITIYEYDYLGRLTYSEVLTSGENGASSFIKSLSYRYNGFRCRYEKDADHIKRYTFDPAGRKISQLEYGKTEREKGPNTRLTEWSYNPLGQIGQKKEWFGAGPKDYSVERNQYDSIGNILQKSIENSSEETLLEKYFTYNFQNLCTEESIFENGEKKSLTQTAYNSQGDPIAFSDQLGNETIVIHNYNHQNRLGQTVLQKKIVNSLGVQTTIEYDTLSRVSTITKKDPFGLLLSNQSFFYDNLGNKVTEINHRIIQGEILESQKTKWIYGPMGRIDAEIQAAETPLQKQTRFYYNTKGQLIEKVLPEGSSIHYQYNKNGHLQKIESKNKKRELELSNRYSYDLDGNIISAHVLHGKTIRRRYNSFQQVTYETVKDGEGSYTQEYTYDRKGRLKEIFLPDHSKIIYSYDTLFGRKVERVQSNGNIAYTHEYNQYDQQGNLLTETHIQNVTKTEYTHDLKGQILSRKNDYFSEEYKRNPLGKILEMSSDKSEKFAYNFLSQIISEKNEKTYSYDSLDNLIESNREIHSYNALNQLLSTPQAQYTYDAQGNLLQKALDLEETHYESNALSQLISIKRNNQTALSFSYDPFGRLLVKKHQDLSGTRKKTLSTTRYIYLGHQEIGTLSTTGEIETLKIPSLDGDQLSTKSVAFELKDQTYLPLHDLSGNVTKLIDPNTSEIVETYQYTAFGQERIFNAHGKEQKTSKNPWRFSEKRVEENTKLILFGLRFYDPSIKRWITPDPAAYSDGPNLYSYLHNDPINHFDRFGLSTETQSPKFDQYFYGEVEKHCFCEKHRTCKRGGQLQETATSRLPRVRHCANFESLHSKDNEGYSRLFDLGLPESEDMEIGYINGMNNTFEEAQETIRYMSKLAGGRNVHAVYNAAHGTLGDLKECRLGLSCVATEPVRQLHKMWNSFFKRSSKKAKFLMVCHSQGAIHVRNALLDYPKELRDRILVVAIAPGGYIYKESCGDVFHYRANWWRDFVPRLDLAGARRERETIVTLESHPNASFFDHSFMSPTYEKNLTQHIQGYLNSKGRTL